MIEQAGVEVHAGSHQRKSTAMSTDLFDAQVPRERQGDVLEALNEAAWGGKVEGVHIIDRQQHNALNVEVTGTIEIDGVERWFHLQSGDWNGTRLLGWEDGPGISHEPREAMTLVPRANAVSDAIATGQAAIFLHRWDRALNPQDAEGRALSALPAAAAYDAFFAPGTGAARTHHEKAARGGYDIAPEGEALALRRQLLGAMLALAPLRGSGQGPQDAALRLAQWDNAPRQAQEVLAGVVQEMAATGRRVLLPADSAPLRALGLEILPCSRALERRAALVRATLSLERIAGFDPATLPQDPFAGLLKALDPALVSGTRVDPVLEGRRLLEIAAREIALLPRLEIPAHYAARAEALGYRLVMAAPPSPEEDSPEP